MRLCRFTPARAAQWWLANKHHLRAGDAMVRFLQQSLKVTYRHTHSFLSIATARVGAVPPVFPSISLLNRAFPSWSMVHFLLVHC